MSPASAAEAGRASRRTDLAVAAVGTGGVWTPPAIASVASGRAGGSVPPGCECPSPSVVFVNTVSYDVGLTEAGEHDVVFQNRALQGGSVPFTFTAPDPTVTIPATGAYVVSVHVDLRVVQGPSVGMAWTTVGGLPTDGLPFGHNVGTVNVARSDVRSLDAGTLVGLRVGLATAGHLEIVNASLSLYLIDPLP